MRLCVILVVLLVTGINGKSRRKLNNEISSAETKHKDKDNYPAPAIIAIEIIDPNENKTSSKNSKRTIESSLGYGYQNFFGPSQHQPRFQIYKYSQHDIPPYRSRGPVFTRNGGGGVSTQNFQIQKSISYDLSNQNRHRYTSIQPSLGQHYKPGTTLFSSINHQGQLAGLSSQIPYQQSHSEAPIPVIILRVHPDHLKNPNSPLFPKLPQSNPYAANLNSVNIGSLLSDYLENMLKKIKLKPSYPTYQTQSQPQEVYQVPPAVQQVAYPQSDHQEVYQQQSYQEEDYQQQSYQQQDHQQHQNYEQQDYQQQYQQEYQEPDYQNYQMQQQYEEPQYQHVPVVAQQHSSTTGLLTHENYPDDAHTKVVFRTDKGHIRTTTHAPVSPTYAAPTETKVIKITIPNQAYSSVEVKTPETQYAYTPGPATPQPEVYYETAAKEEQQPQYYYTQGEQNYQIYQQQAPVEQLQYQNQQPEYVTQVPQVIKQPKQTPRSQQARPHHKRRSRSKKSNKKITVPIYSVKEIHEETVD